MPTSHTISTTIVSQRWHPVPPGLACLTITWIALTLLPMASLADNAVASWGRQVLPTPAEMKPLMDVSSGHGFNLGLRPDQTVVAWGSNNFREATIPEEVHSVTAIAAGSRHAVVLRNNGTVIAWGDNRQQQATPPSQLEEVRAITAGHEHSVALQEDGTIVGWGNNRYGQTAVPDDLDEVVAISSGLFHNLALRRDGTVAAWGLNTDHQANVPEELDDVIAIAAGGFHSLALRGDGSVVAWGNNDFGQISLPSNLSNVRRIQAGDDHNLALLDNGSVVAWGRNDHGQTNVPNNLPPGRRIAAGNHHNVVLLDDGSTIAWGNNNTGQSLNLHDLKDVVAVSAWENQSIALKRDGSVFWWGANWAAGADPNPADLRNVVAVATGRAHGLALRSNGTVVGWGDNLYGQSTPPADLTGVVQIAAGDFHSLALRDNGQVVAWGSNFQGQTAVPRGLGKIVAIAAGREHSIALNYGGIIFGWGNNFYHQREVPTGADDVVEIAAGSYHNVALKSDGTVIAWGSALFGQTSVPRGLSDTVAVAASRSHSVVLRESREAAAWGSNHYGQATIPEGLGPIVNLAAGGSRTVAVTGPLQPPRVVRPLDSRLVPAGEDLFVMPAISGSPPFRYQWMKDGRPLPGRNRPALVLPSLTAADTGTYSLILANPRGNISSRPFSIEVEDPAVRVVANPRVAVLGERATFTARAHGTGPFSFQWYRDGEAIPGAEEAILVFETVADSHTGIYHVEVSGEIDSSVSETINFLIEPHIQTHPPEVVAARLGERTTLSLTAIGSPPLTIRWFRNGQPVSEGTEQTLTLENLSMEDTGTYSAIVSNPAGRVSSEESDLQIIPHLVLQPESQVFSVFGGTAVFEIRAIGSLPLTYYWFKNGNRLTETRDPRLVLERIQPDDAGEYHVVVSNPVGQVSSERAILMVPPGITHHPRSQTVRTGDSVEMSVRARGGKPIEYQWLRNEEPIPHATDASLKLENVDGGDTARYSVVVSNPVGKITSQTGSLSVAPSILRQPEGISVRQGNEITLMVEADGSRPLFFQWSKEGTPLPNANEPTLPIDRATTDHAGFYSVIISNAAGIAVSDTVEVTVE